LNLYQWTVGKIESSHWFIRILQKKFNAKGVKTLRVVSDEENENLKTTDDVAEGTESTTPSLRTESL
jgi:hypothetical protein